MADNNSGSLVWFVAGAAIGASIALLYAPQSGRDTRRYLNKKTRQGREVLEDVGQEFAERGRDLYKKGRGLADDAAELLERGRKIVEG
jgi:gas vesicle protein